MILQYSILLLFVLASLSSEKNCNWQGLQQLKLIKPDPLFMCENREQEEVKRGAACLDSADYRPPTEDRHGQRQGDGPRPGQHQAENIIRYLFFTNIL